MANKRQSGPRVGSRRASRPMDTASASWPSMASADLAILATPSGGTS